MPVLEDNISTGVFDALDTGLIVLGGDRRIVLWNAWMSSASAIPADRAVGRRLDELFPPFALNRLDAAVGDALEAGASSIITHSLHPGLLPLRTRAGRELIYNLSVRPLGGSRSECLVQVADVTQMAHRERVLRQRQNARYDAVVNSASDPILTLDANGLIQLANPAAARQFGYSPEELLGRPIALLFEKQQAWATVWFSVMRGEALTSAIEIAARRKDGSPSYVEISASRWFSDSRTFVTVILRDVNQRRAAEEALRALNQTLEQRVDERTAELMQAEEQLRQSQKMEAVGQLTGGIAHDFNNLLAGIVGALDLMQTRLEQGRPADLQRYISAAMSSAQRAAALTHRLLAFSRRQPLDPKPIDANKLVAEMEDLLRRTMGPSISLEISLAGALWRTLCDRVQLESALLNLCINSRDAMPEGGTLTITTGNATLVDPGVAARLGIEPGEYVELSVADTGSGMPADVIDRAFDPFYTTKPTGQGTGLGLSMVYGFAKQSQGHARIQSEPGQGTTIAIYLPRYLGPAGEDDEEAAVHDEASARFGGTVLVVEDEAAVRDMMVEVLQDMGYRTLTAKDGPGGLELIRSGKSVDLLVTDIGLPGIDGRQLAEHARQAWPAVKVLFVTGYAMSATVADGFLEPGMALITKPFAVSALAGKVRQLVNAPTPRDQRRA